MSRCLRIFGAYSFRLTRRHSTLLLIASFIVMVTAVLQLYAYRHHDHLHHQPILGDFIYKPGKFLRGKQPQNQSYCMFNYGLPDTLKWDSFRIYPSPETGSQSSYRVIYDAITGMAYANYSKTQAVTYVTQATPEFLYHIVEIARYWDGPISIAVYVPRYDLDLTMQIMKQLCHCYPGMMKVSLHLFYPKRIPPKIRTLEEKMRSLVTAAPTVSTTNETVEDLLRKRLENYRRLDNKTRAKYIQWVRKNKVERMMMKLPVKGEPVANLPFKDCSGLDSYDFDTFRKSTAMMYPINVGRNVARNASKTNYFLVSDIEMIPSRGLATKFLKMVRKLMGDEKRDSGCVFAKTVFVVPLFEVIEGQIIPHDKETLVRMVASNRAMYFHQRVCIHCQRFPGLQTWLIRTPTDALEPMLISKREYPYHRWEPLYFGSNKEPWYSEMLTWEGRQDKMTQIMEMCLQGYDFHILDGGFMVHSYRKYLWTSDRFSNKAKYSNRVKYMIIIYNLKKIYKPDKNSLCQIMDGFTL
ncbi:beta-1,4-glucuronyltransferase 1-like isoform X2 [Anticarsia gemmatalis]|uniref:beta-1,4-glucuronyltransferase 1-like isoform X2 n=1 Tax=Anticarsia gemmatalis TaxID=129554 RepID=UPI003F77223F